MASPPTPENAEPPTNPEDTGGITSLVVSGLRRAVYLAKVAYAHVMVVLSPVYLVLHPVWEWLRRGSWCLGIYAGAWNSVSEALRRIVGTIEVSLTGDMTHALNLKQTQVRKYWLEIPTRFLMQPFILALYAIFLPYLCFCLMVGMIAAPYRFRRPEDEDKNGQSEQFQRLLWLLHRREQELVVTLNEKHEREVEVATAEDVFQRLVVRAAVGSQGPQFDVDGILEIPDDDDDNGEDGGDGDDGEGPGGARLGRGAENTNMNLEEGDLDFEIGDDNRMRLRDPRLEVGNEAENTNISLEEGDTKFFAGDRNFIETGESVLEIGQGAQDSNITVREGDRDVSMQDDNVVQIPGYHESIGEGARGVTIDRRKGDAEIKMGFRNKIGATPQAMKQAAKSLELLFLGMASKFLRVENNKAIWLKDFHDKQVAFQGKSVCKFEKSQETRVARCVKCQRELVHVVRAHHRIVYDGENRVDECVQGLQCTACSRVDYPLPATPPAQPQVQSDPAVPSRLQLVRYDHQGMRSVQPLKTLTTCVGGHVIESGETTLMRVDFFLRALLQAIVSDPSERDVEMAALAELFSQWKQSSSYLNTMPKAFTAEFQSQFDFKPNVKDVECSTDDLEPEPVTVLVDTGGAGYMKASARPDDLVELLQARIAASLPGNLTATDIQLLHNGQLMNPQVRVIGYDVKEHPVVQCHEVANSNWKQEPLPARPWIRRPLPWVELRK